MGFLDSISGAFKGIPVLNTLSNVSDLVKGIASGDLGQILSSVSSLAITYATGGTGALFGQVSSLVSNLAQQSFSSIGSSLMGQIGLDNASSMISEALTGALGIEQGLAAIQLIGNKMGLSQNSIDAAQGAFAESMGDKQEAREQFTEAGMYKKGSLFRRTDRVDSGERARSNDLLNMIKGNAPGQQQPASIADTVAALIAGPNASALQLGAALGMVGASQGSLNNIGMQLMNQLLTNQNEEAQRGTGGGQGRSGGAAGAGAAGGAGSAGGASGAGGATPSTVGPTTGNGSVSGSNSILMNIAMALGGVIDEKMEGMDKVATKLGELGDDDQKGYGQLTAEMTALGQEMKMVQEALNNTLKSIGEAAAGLARKQ